MTQPEHSISPWQVSYPRALRDSVETAAEAWQNFCELDTTVQDIFSTTNHFNGTGFERKTGDGSQAGAFSNDTKLNFDVTRTGVANLLRIAASLDDHPGNSAKKFISSCEDLIEQSQSVIQDVGDIIETNSGVKGFKELATQSGENAFFRFLLYPAGVPIGTVVGEPHPDNSGFTLHLKESTDGCEWLDGDKTKWHTMPIEEGKATAFASMQTQLNTNGEIDALWHRITANETTSKVGRIAIVCFVSLKDTPKYDKQRHGRLQNFQLGSTYGMEPEEFKTLFQ